MSLAVGKYLLDFISMFDPGVLNDWGDGCRKNRARAGGLNGYCSVKSGVVEAMVHYGEDVSKEISKIEIPSQFAGVESDPTAENSAMGRAFKVVKNGKFCFYPLHVPHSIVNPNKDLIPDLPEFKSMREKGLPSGPPL